MIGDVGHARSKRTDAFGPRSGRILALDVGAGTLDVLLGDANERPENWTKMVVPSRTVLVARQIEAATRSGATVVFHGQTMGGGANAAAAHRHAAAGLRLLVTERAALSFADDIERVREWGAEVVGEEEAVAAIRGGATEVRSADVDLPALLHALRAVGAGDELGAVAVAAQDHGFSPRESNRVVRFRMWERAVAERRRLVDLFYRGDHIPPDLTRLSAAAADLRPLEVPVLAADTGPAALLGAMSDDGEDAVLVNVGNGHTVCVVASKGRLAGVFEHHTGRLDAARLEVMLRAFLAGDLDDDEVRRDGGHGATSLGVSASDLPLLVTGPNRDLLAHSQLVDGFPAPFGDMMMTGPAGLLRAFRTHGF